MKPKIVWIAAIWILIISFPTFSNAQKPLSIHNTSDCMRVEKTIEEFVRLGGQIEYSALDQRADIERMTTQQIINAVAAGEIIPIETKQDYSSLFMIGETVYGCVISVYKSWFRVASTALWHELGIQPPEGIITWEELMELAVSVRAYNQAHGAQMNLLDSQYGRFEKSALMTENSEIYEQWQQMQDVIGSENALFEECVLTLDVVGNASYVTGIDYGGRCYPLSKPEMRCFVISADTDQAQQAQKFLELYASYENIGMMYSGIIPSELPYRQFQGQNGGFSTTLSEENYEMWKAL